MGLVTILNGAALMRLQIFETNGLDSLEWFKRKILVAMVIYYILIFLFIAFAVCLIKYPPRFNNIATAIFGLSTFFFGFIPMLASGVSLLDFASITNEEMELECSINEDPAND